MGYHWGLGILHNDGNCLDCDFGDTYDRSRSRPASSRAPLRPDVRRARQGRVHHRQKGELGRSVDLDTLDDGYRLALEISRVDTPRRSSASSTRTSG